MTDVADRKLAILGGEPMRATPMPPRFALGAAEEAMIQDVLAHYRARDLDPGYQGHFEQLYCDAFVDFQGGGYADSVATGTAAIFVGLAALELPKGSEVLVSPITDPGTLSAIVLNGLKPRLVDAKPNSYNVGPDEFEAAITPACSAGVIVHAVGQAVEIDGVVDVAQRHGIKVLEDCSQAHGAGWKGQRVGTFGDIAAFSTMYRKAHMSGASGGMIYTQDLDLHRMALAHADRGKPTWQEDLDDRNPSQFLFPALNLHSDEISCAMGLASLQRLETTIEKRLDFVARFTQRLEETSHVCRPYGYTKGDSPFIYPVFVDPSKISCTVEAFANAVRAEGIGLNPHYEYLVANWPFLKPHMAEETDTPNARTMLDTSFALYLNENYGEAEVEDCIAAISKVEGHYQSGDNATDRLE
ncbi:DegT/DnrJ/EryC1/StrS family aminotransferase [Magnetovibrio sp. PR-2]|uniref:DegT/DnrJ/EryC1/StrS family aminotransferase n=1 Tax=Magnetovibrio sp. PR-2 TaxID=3120356 RepID=UPI002FCE15F9